jgi:3-dehydroshikimate dehydratase
MLSTGLVSVTLRRFKPADVVKYATEAKLKYVEWGGDVHVLPCDLDNAREVARMTRDAGMEIAAYGSYYRVGAMKTPNTHPFEAVLETAVAMEAPMIRVWAGDRASKEANDSQVDSMARETRSMADLAAQAGIRLGFEFHGNTLNDRSSASKRLMEKIDHENVGTLWQVSDSSDVEVMQRGLKRIRKWLTNIHVFHWHEGQRRPLEEGEMQWLGYLEVACSTGRDHVALLEFVQDDSPMNIARDAAVLRQIIKDAVKMHKEKSGRG